MAAITILNRYTGAPIATFPGPTLNGVVFAGLNMTNADFSGQDLTSANFAGCNAQGATFQNANCTGTIFQNGTVDHGDFRGITKSAASNFHGCFFEDVILDLADQNVGAWALPSGYSGQSNCSSRASGATSGLPQANIPMYFEVQPLGGSSGGLWLPLQIDPVDGNHGAEIIFAQTLKALGYDIGVCKISRDATTMSDWTPGLGPQYTSPMVTGYLAAMTQMQTVWPGKFSRWNFDWYLGEDDSRSEGNGSVLYGPEMLSMLVGLSGLVRNNVWKWFICTRTASWLGFNVPTCLANCRYWQMYLPSGRYLDTDGLAHQPDNVHLTAPGQDALGALWATLWQTVVPSSAP